MSKISDEFIIHGNHTEYDYDYSTPKKKKLIEVLAKVFMDENKKDLTICGIDKKSLKDFVTSKKVKKKNPSVTKMPGENTYISINYFLYGVEGERTSLTRNSGMIYKTSNVDAIKILKDQIKNSTIQNFKKIKLVGISLYSSTYIVEHLQNKEVFLMKEIKKIKLIELNLIECALNEKKILEQMDHPFLMKCILNFQDEENIYTLCHFMKGGDMYSELKRCKNFDVER